MNSTYGLRPAIRPTKTPYIKTAMCKCDITTREGAQLAGFSGPPQRLFATDEKP
jgi:hypothetical protein